MSESDSKSKKTTKSSQSKPSPTTTRKSVAKRREEEDSINQNATMTTTTATTGNDNSEKDKDKGIQKDEQLKDKPENDKEIQKEDNNNNKDKEKEDSSNKDTEMTDPDKEKKTSKIVTPKPTAKKPVAKKKAADVKSNNRSIFDFIQKKDDTNNDSEPTNSTESTSTTTTTTTTTTSTTIESPKPRRTVKAPIRYIDTLETKATPTKTNKNSSILESDFIKVKSEPSSETKLKSTPSESSSKLKRSSKSTSKKDKSKYENEKSHKRLPGNLLARFKELQRKKQRGEEQSDESNTEDETEDDQDDSSSVSSSDSDRKSSKKSKSTKRKSKSPSKKSKSTRLKSKSKHKDSESESESDSQSKSKLSSKRRVATKSTRSTRGKKKLKDYSESEESEDISDESDYEPSNSESESESDDYVEDTPSDISSESSEQESEEETVKRSKKSKATPKSKAPTSRAKKGKTKSLAIIDEVKSSPKKGKKQSTASTSKKRKMDEDDDIGDSMKSLKTPTKRKKSQLSLTDDTNRTRKDNAKSACRLGFLQRYSLPKYSVPEIELLVDHIPVENESFNLIIDQDIVATYLPNVAVSTTFGFKDEPTQTLDRFNSISIKSKLANKFDLMFYVGGNVRTMDWCPLPTSSFSEKQYIAVGCNNDLATLHYKDGLYGSNNMVQIWEFECLKNVDTELPTKPSMVMGIANTGSFVVDLKWLPNGAIKDERLGVLAAALGDGTVKIWSIPNPSKLDDTKKNYMGFHLLDIKPLFETKQQILSEKEETPRGIRVTTIDWSISDSQLLLVLGHYNGLITLYDLKRLTTKSNLPIFIRKEREGVQGLSFCPFDSNHFVSVHNTYFCLWDKRDPFQPVQINAMNFCWKATIMWPTTVFPIFATTQDDDFRYYDPINDIGSVSRIHKGLITSLDLSTNMTFAASSSEGSVKLFHIYGSKKKIERREYHVEIERMDYDKENSILYILPTEKNVDIQPQRNFGQQSLTASVAKKNSDLWSFEDPKLIINKLVWNKNQNASRWLAYGGGFGLVRVKIGHFKEISKYKKD